jgi:hypothetical protein
MKDVSSIGEYDLMFGESAGNRADSLCRVQVGDKYYEPGFGIDYDYFINNPIEFQNTSFKAHIVNSMSRIGINVSDVQSIIANFVMDTTYTIKKDT